MRYWISPAPVPGVVGKSAGVKYVWDIYVWEISGEEIYG